MENIEREEGESQTEGQYSRMRDMGKLEDEMKEGCGD